MMSRERAAGLRGALGAGGMVVVCFLLSFAFPAQDVTENPPAGQDASAPRPTKHATDLAARAERMGNRGKLALGFEANQGQTDAQVRFLSRGVGYTLFLTDDEAVLALRKPSADSDQLTAFRNSTLATHNWLLPEELWPRPTGYGPRTTDPGLRAIANLQSTIDNPPAPRPLPLAPSVLCLKLVGANPKTRVIGLNELLAKSNYFLGRDPKKWRTRVPSYATVRYEDVYPGIDLVYYGNQGQLEFDFILAPGADPNAIRLEIVGTELAPPERAQQAAPLHINANGDLVISTDAGDVRFHRPIVLQPTTNNPRPTADHGPRTMDTGSPKSKIANPKSAESHYVLLADNRIGFEVSNYDRSLPLVIDPVLSYSTYLGGSGFDYGSGIAVDSAGNAYVTGYTNSIDFPLVSPARAAPGGGSCGTSPDAYACFDAFVAKVDPTGSAIVYSTYFGGSGEDYGSKIAVDSLGNAYVTGYTNSTDLPSVNPAQSVQGGGICGVSPCFDAFVAKLNSTGTALVYSTYLGGSADDYGQGIAVDSTGNALVTGSTASADFPTVGAFESVHGGAAYDAFVTKLGPAGSTLVYSTYLGGGGEDYGSDIAVDAPGNAYMTGYTNSTDFPTAGPLQAVNGGGTCGAPPNTIPCFDAYVAKLNVDGSSLVYSTYLGGSGGDYGYGIAVDASGSAYVTGLTTSIDFPVTAGAFQLAGGGTSVDAYVVKLDPTGSSAVYSTYLGGTGAEAGLDIAVDPSGNAYVAGYAYGNSLPLASPLQATNGGYYDAFLSKLNAAGSALIFSSYLGGGGNEKARGVAVDPSGNAYLTGDTFSTDFPITSGAFQAYYGSGAFDAFVAKFGDLALPMLRLAEAEVTFSAQGVGTPSPAHTVTLANIGDAELALSSITASGDFAQTNNCPVAVAPGVACTLSITFTPAELGPRRGTITIASSAYGAPHVLQMEGTGVAAPAVSLSATYLRFADQPLGTTSTPLPVKLTNSGQAPLAITSISTSGHYAQTNNCVSPLAARAFCTINVTFTPTVVGGQSGTLTIVDNAPGSPHTVALGGIGVGPVATLSATSLNFGNQSVGTTSVPRLVNLSNTGNAPMTIASITVSGDFGQTNNCPSTLAARGYCTMTVTFMPAATGPRIGAITVTDNAPGSPHVVSLTGTGIAPAVSLSATYLRFADQPLGTTSTPLPVRLTNSGQAPLAITSISTSGHYAQTNNCVSPLAARASCTINVTFTPTVVGGQSGTLTLVDNAPGSPHTVALGGVGVGPVATLSATSLNFGNQSVGTTSAPRLVNLSNTGNAPMTVASITVSGDFGQTNNCPSTLAARGYCTMTVTFMPVATGPRSGAITVADNAAGSPHVVSLSGTGVSP
jgi:hypothetical protein